MTSRGRVSLSLAAVGLVALTVVGIWNRPGSDGALREFEWGGIGYVDSNAISNQVRVAVPFDADQRRMAYYTGGNASGSGGASAAPKRVIAQAVHGDVTVRMRAFDSYRRERASDEAEEVARIISLATTRVWPARPTPVEVDVHFIADDAPLSLAKRVDWREGDSYEIAVFTRENERFHTGTALHELYHALAIRWSIGTKGSASRSRPNAALTYEEVAGDLFALCGQLLASESLPRARLPASVDLDDRRFEVPLSGDDLGAALDWLSSEERFSEAFAQGFRLLLVWTITADAFGEQQTIALGSPQADRLLARCREFAANPMLLEFRLAEMQRMTRAQPEPRALEN